MYQQATGFRALMSGFGVDDPGGDSGFTTMVRQGGSYHPVEGWGSLVVSQAMRDADFAASPLAISPVAAQSVAGWGALERGRGRVRVAARYAAQLPLMDPLYNLREAAKELLLLEDHLCHPQKHCPDCIRKHLLTTEALLEEAVRLDTEGEKLGLLSPLPAQVRELWTAYQDGRPKHEIGQSARVLRKGLVEASAAVRVGAPGTYQRSSAPWNGYGVGEAAIVASATRRGVEWPLSAPKAPTNALKKIAVTLGAYLLVVSLWKAGSRRPR